MKIEFAVQMTCQSCVEKVQRSLSDLGGITKIDIDLLSGTVIVDTDLAQSIIKDKIESTGMRAVLKGYGQLGAAVAMLGGDTGFSAGQIKGVIRFVQEENGQCLIDGELESPCPKPSPLNISIYECGDISNSCSNVGNRLLSILNQTTVPNGETSGSHTTESSHTKPENFTNGHSTPLVRTPTGVVVKTKDRIEVGDIIGRSLVVEDGERNKLACAVIARSAGVSQNKKVICACDGVTIWEERDKPLAGPGRREE